MLGPRLPCRRLKCESLDFEQAARDGFQHPHKSITWAPTQGPVVALSLNGSVCSDGSTLTQQPGTERRGRLLVSKTHKIANSFHAPRASRSAPSSSAKSPGRHCHAPQGPCTSFNGSDGAELTRGGPFPSTPWQQYASQAAAEAEIAMQDASPLHELSFPAAFVQPASAEKLRPACHVQPQPPVPRMASMHPLISVVAIPLEAGTRLAHGATAVWPVLLVVLSIYTAVVRPLL